jgi:tRNA nucleotidyltransferase (CCA-adding enzyme)
MADERFIVILTHEHTDFDALASLLAAHKLYPNAVPVLPRMINRNLRDFLALYRSALPFRLQEELPRRRVDYVIVVDTQTFSTIKGMRPDTPGQIIDHHPLQRELEPGWSYWGDEVGATATLLVEQIADRQISLTPVEATLLLLGIYEDTGSLVYVTTTTRDLGACAWLLDQGANLQVVNRFLHHPLTQEQADLYTQLAENSNIHEVTGHSIVIASASAPDYGDEISTLAHKLRDVYDPSGLFLVVDLGDRIQVVARSTTDAVDVGAITQELGGGGHGRAAAALVRSRTPADVEAHLLDLLHDMVRPSTTVDRIMTHGYPTTVAPDTTVGDMMVITQRYGFEGYPVVDGEVADDLGKRSAYADQIRGLITRRQVDRALHHGLVSHTIDHYMRTGQVWVTPDQSIAELQKVMIESGWGQIPVVDSENRAIVGIVTRTDLIKLWGKPVQASRREDIALHMETSLPKPLHDLLQVAGNAAEALDFPLYAVGGFVRDLLLSRPNFDVDLVVEGDAIDLARFLAKEYGGRVRSHRRFGTAKWILPEPPSSVPGRIPGDGAKPGLPPGLNGILAAPASLDFVSARTEFYEEPTALPTVEHGSIKLDLHRRDFTVNTLAICLNPGRWGELLDFYGGERDLQEGLIRVLHTHSFVDDPTRILRALRFEQRFGFRIEQRTAELMADSVDLLDRITPARVRHELELIFLEAQPEHVLRRMQEIGAVAYIHPDLRTDDWVAERFERLRRAIDPYHLPAEMDQLYFAIWTYRLDRSQIPALDRRLTLMRSTISLLENLHELKGHEVQLGQPRLQPSEIYQILKPAMEASRLLMRIITESDLMRERIDLFETELRGVRLHVDGQDLKRLGLTPGPAYRRILDKTRNAWLNGELFSAEEERLLVEHLVAAELQVQHEARQNRRSR